MRIGLFQEEDIFCFLIKNSAFLRDLIYNILKEHCICRNGGNEMIKKIGETEF